MTSPPGREPGRASSLHTRRALLRAGAGAVTAVAAAGLPARAAGAAPPGFDAGSGGGGVDGAQVAWVRGAQEQLLGITPDGSLIGPIPPPDERTDWLRAPDGRHWYVVRGREDGQRFVTTVQVYSLASGVLLQTIVGHSFPRGTDLDLDLPAPFASPDGRYLVLLHHLRRIDPATIRSVGKGDEHILVGAGTTTIGLEVLDLASGRSTGYRELETAAGENDPLFVRFAVFAPDGGRLYVVTGRARPGYGEDYTLTVVGLAGGQPRVEARANEGQPGHVLPLSSFYGQPPACFQDTGATLVLADMSHVVWLDLRTLNQTGDATLDYDLAARPFNPVALLAPDGRTLYVVSSGFGTVRTVDLVRRAYTGKVPLPLGPVAGSVAPGDLPRPGSYQTAALSPDGARLYDIDGRTATGIAVARLPALRLIARWLPDRALHALWPSPDGRTIYAIADRGEAVYVLGSDGTLRHAVRPGVQVANFA
ncbi:MAG TPA: hypothetical protein VFL91_16785 [Thermomicrobiales bacterium]|nr:hypothetical protein [Thermomicrobiales bacterium]